MPISLHALASEPAAHEALIRLARSLVADSARLDKSSRPGSMLRRVLSRADRVTRKSGAGRKKTMRQLAKFRTAELRMALGRLSNCRPDAEAALLDEAIGALVDEAFRFTRERMDAGEIDPLDVPPVPVETGDPAVGWELEHRLVLLRQLRKTDFPGDDDMRMGGSWAYAGSSGKLAPWEREFKTTPVELGNDHAFKDGLLLLPGWSVYVANQTLLEVDWLDSEDAEKLADEVSAYLAIILVVATELCLNAATVAAVAAGAAHGVPPPLVQAIMSLLTLWLAGKMYAFIGWLTENLGAFLADWIGHEHFESFSTLAFIEWNPPLDPVWHALVAGDPCNPSRVEGRGSVLNSGLQELRQKGGSGRYSFQLRLLVHPAH